MNKQSTWPLCSALVATAALTCAPPVARADKKDDAWTKCLKLCPIAGLAGPEGPAAWALGCTAGYAAAKLRCRFFANNIGTDPYVPRFAFDSLIIDNTPATFRLSAGRYGNGGLIAGPGSVQQVLFSFATTEASNAVSTDPETDGQFYSIPWNALGAGTFNPSTNMWDLTIPRSMLFNHNGDVLRAEFIDPAIGLPPSSLLTPGDLAGHINTGAFVIVPAPGFAAAALTLGAMGLLPRRRTPTSRRASTCLA